MRLLVGPSRREFLIHKKLLCASSSFFRYSLESLSDPGSPTSPSPTSPVSVASDASTASASSVSPTEKLLWLSEEAPEVMELFVQWLYQRHAFRGILEHMVAAVSIQPTPTDQARVLKARRALHWNLVKLHLFAAVIRLPTLQDAAMDAVQDLYLRCDMDVSLGFLRFLYAECSREQAFRLRTWAVAMLAWRIASRPDPDDDDDNDHNQNQDELLLFGELPALREDYARHLAKMAASRADVRVKNPQLRLPRNKLRNEERHFGFRQCSFHSHRALVGEGACPYSTAAAVAAAALGVGADETEAPESPLEQVRKKKTTTTTTTVGNKDVPRTTAPARQRHARLRSQTSQIWTVHESAEET